MHFDKNLEEKKLFEIEHHQPSYMDSSFFTKISITYDQPLFINHKDYGEGMITSIRGGKYTMKFFDTGNKAFKFPISELNPSDPDFPIEASPEIIEILSKIYNVEYNVYKNNKARKEDPFTTDYKEQKFVCTYSSPHDYSQFRLQIRGAITRALNIPFESDKDKVNALAFLAAANVSLRANTYIGDSLDEFLEKYPNVKEGSYYVDYNENAMIKATNYHIGLSQKPAFIDILPPELQEHRNVNTGAIYRTAFVSELVDDYGFNFGTIQDPDEIHKAIETEFPFLIDYYDKCFEEHSQNLKDIGYQKGLEEQEQDFTDLEEV